VLPGVILRRETNNDLNCTSYTAVASNDVVLFFRLLGTLYVTCAHLKEVRLACGATCRLVCTDQMQTHAQRYTHIVWQCRLAKQRSCVVSQCQRS
jgi:hypothetical protein